MAESKEEVKPRQFGALQDFNNLSLNMKYLIRENDASKHSFSLKIKFLDKGNNAYFSDIFQTKIP